MCAINPTHKKRIILDVYTSENITKEKFDSIVREQAFYLEVNLNKDTRLRWHVKETDQEAD